MPDHFQLLKTDTVTAARRARLQTRHGTIETPIFMPVGTQGTVKSLTPAHLKEIGAQIILGNTYHLNLRPGSELVRDLGRLLDGLCRASRASRYDLDFYRIAHGVPPCAIV
jgi:queuine tRNA-ribosyltransferase